MRGRVRVRALAAVAGTAVVVALVGPAVPARAAETQRYIVTTTSDAATASKVGKLGAAKVDHRYRHAIDGFSATLTTAQVAQLKADPAVESVIEDGRVEASAVTQPDAPWGLDRIDQRTGPTNGSYTYQSTGAGVTSYVVDTGIRMDVADFGGRATSGYDFVDRDTDASDCPKNYVDDVENGLVSHGTHVAGSLGGTTYGVAKGTSIVSLRVLDCDGDGWISDVVAALDWVVANHPSSPSVVNMSLGGGADAATDAAVQGVIAAGIPVVAAAGNDARNACSYSPARVPAALTVGASAENDEQAWDFTNYGPCLDLFAPGEDIVSAGTSTTTSALTLSGTSMAAPHVAGAVARYLQLNPTATPAQVSAAIVGGSSNLAGLADPDGSPTKLLYTYVEGVSGPAKVTGTRSDARKTATVSWAAPSVTGPGRAAITGYRLVRTGKDTAGRGSVTVDVSAGTRSYTFGGLKAGTAYTLSVQPRNAFGLGTTASTKQTITALPGAPKITAAGSGSTKNKSVTIGVKWAKPTSGGAVQRYVVTATRNSTGSVRTVTVSGTARSATVSGLKNKKTYTIRLRAVNDSGTGPTVRWAKAVKAR